MFYATGGYAYGGVKTNIDSAFLNGPVNTRFSATKGGWTAGAGIETPFTLLGLFGPNWTSKTEYLYVDLGSTTGSSPIRRRRRRGHRPPAQEPHFPQRAELPLQLAGGRQVLIANTRLK